MIPIDKSKSLFRYAASVNAHIQKHPVSGVSLLYLDFVLTGVVMTLLGPMLPMLSVRWALNDAQAGYLFTAQFAASIVGMLLSSILVERFGYRITLLSSLLIMAVGVAALARADWIFGLISVCIFGLGFGINTPAANLRIARTNPDKAASALNLLNSSWGVGAMASPLLVASVQHSRHTPQFLYCTAAALMGLAAYMSAVSFSMDGQAESEKKAVVAKSRIWNNRFLFIVAVLFFIYVGTENSVGGWVASYARRIDSHALWAITPSFFWGALLLGRFSAPLALRRVRETRLATAGVALAAIGVVTLLAAKAVPMIMVGAAISGLGLASVFPISVSLLTRWFGETAPRISGAIFSCGNFGGAVLPWAVGALSTHFGSLRAGFMIPLLGSLSMLIFYLAHGNSRILK
jgi:FHS family glucose/mannose:H+ symporter-like MFS transporter